MRSTWLLFSVVGVASCAVFQSTFHRRDSFKTQLKKAGKWDEYLRSRESRRSGKKGTYPQHVNDYWDFVYVGNVSVGTPPQNFTVDLDTGSADFFVPNTRCNYYQFCDVGTCERLNHADPEQCHESCPPPLCEGKVFTGKGQCKPKRFFKSNASSTFKADGAQWSISYGQGGASGFNAVDTIRLGDDGSLAVTNYDFGLATCMDPTFKEDQTSDGMFGLSPGSTGEGGEKKTVLEVAYEQGHLDQPLFTVWLEEKGDVSNVRAGVFTFGGIDVKNCGPVLDYRTVTKGDVGSGPEYVWWKFDADGISIGNYSSKEKLQVVSDSGTTLIIANREYAKPLAQHAGAQYSDDAEEFPIDCNATFAPVVLHIGDKQYPIDHKQLVIKQPSGDSCTFGIGAFAEKVGQFDILLGDPWVRAYCQIHDFGQKRIGFAKANP